jgi:predicted ferric reductase
MQPRGENSYIISFRIEELLGWVITFVLCVIPLVFWAHINPFSQINNISSVMINIGRVTGLIGIVMYSLNLIYATRLRFLEYLFGGLNRVYIAHHIIGGLALIFLSLHPLFLAMRYIQVSLMQVSLFLLPNNLAPIGALFNTHSPYHSQVLQQWALAFGIVAFWGMVGLLLVTFFIKLPYKFWLMTHKYLGVFFIIAVMHLLFINSDTTVSLPLRVYLLTISGLGIAAYIYKTLVGKILIRTYRYDVQDVRQKANGVLEVRMYPEALAMSYKPGQFVFIRFLGAGSDGISDEWHPFSITSTPGEAVLSVTIKGLGDYTNNLARLLPGTQAEVEGAYGKFSYREFKNPNQIWVAGGIGITPFLSMVKSLPADGFNVDLYYSVRTASEVIDWPLLYNAAMTHGGKLRVIPYISDQQQGHLSADFIEQNSGPLAKRDFYMCGPPPMMQSLKKQLRAKSVPATSIHSEEFAMS